MVGLLLDTCVFAELGKEPPNVGLATTVATTDAQSLFVSAITLGELAKGIALLTLSHRRTNLEQRLEIIEADFDDRILGFDRDTARVWGEITARAQLLGTPLPSLDGMIAATAIRHNLRVMTRNVRHFEPTGVESLNPWSDE